VQEGSVQEGSLEVMKNVTNRKGVGDEWTNEKVATMDNGIDSVWLDSTVRRDESSDRFDSGGLVDLV
jgi:hypothetical protein